MISASLLVVSIGFMGCSVPLPGVRVLSAVANAPHAQVRSNYAVADATSSSSDESLRKTFESALPDDVRASMRWDPSLDCVAGDMALVSAEYHRSVATSLTSWLFWKCGVVSQYDWVFYGYDPTGATTKQGQEQLDEQIRSYAGRLRRGREPRSYGIARFYSRTANIGAGQAFVIAREPVTVKTFPKVYAPGAKLIINAQLRSAYTEPVLYMDMGKGDVQDRPLVPVGGGSIEATLSVPSAPGRYFIEIMAREPVDRAADPHNPWRRSLLLTPIYVAASPSEPAEPATPDDFVIRNPAPNDRDPTTWKDTILRAYNAERDRHGRRALAVTAQVTSIAQEHSVDVADSEQELPPDAKLRDKLGKAGLHGMSYLESYGSFEFVSEYIKLELLRPAVRKALLAPETSLAAIGITPRAQRDGYPQNFAVVEYLIGPDHR
jgi:hypothetical protein